MRDKTTSIKYESIRPKRKEKKLLTRLFNYIISGDERSKLGLIINYILICRFQERERERERRLKTAKQMFLQRTPCCYIYSEKKVKSSLIIFNYLLSLCLQSHCRGIPLAAFLSPPPSPLALSLSLFSSSNQHKTEVSALLLLFHSLRSVVFFCQREERLKLLMWVLIFRRGEIINRYGSAAAETVSDGRRWW